MNKAQAIDNFWNGFGIPAYDENSVPDDAKMPYITYSVAEDDIDSPVSLSASIWYKSTSWKSISLKAEEISRAITTMNPPTLKLDQGRLHITKGTPFAQRMSDPSSDIVRRIYINIQAEFLTAY